jgi:hypothetical protein
MARTRDHISPEFIAYLWMITTNQGGGQSEGHSFGNRIGAMQYTTLSQSQLS